MDSLSTVQIKSIKKINKATLIWNQSISIKAKHNFNPLHIPMQIMTLGLPKLMLNKFLQLLLLLRLTSFFKII